MAPSTFSRMVTICWSPTMKRYSVAPFPVARDSPACITVVNALQRYAMSVNAFLAAGFPASRSLQRSRRSEPVPNSPAAAHLESRSIRGWPDKRAA